jgi:hypothetical protein
MKSTAPMLALVACVITCSCGTTTRYVTLGELESRLQADTKKQSEAGGRPWYQWSYVGTAEDRHYFRRQVGAMFRSELHDGFYGIPKESMSLAGVEFNRPKPDNSTQWKGALTQRDSFGMPSAYSTRFDVEGAPESKKEAQQVAAPNP